MKRTIGLFKVLGSLIIIFAVVMYSQIYAYAEDDFFVSDTDKLIDSLYSESGADRLFSALPDNAKGFLGMLYIEDFKPDSLDNLSIDSFIRAIAFALRESLFEPLRVFVCVVGIIVITSMFDALRSPGLSEGLEQTLSFVSVLCMSAVLTPQMLKLITELMDTITAGSDFMMIYVPVISILIISGGKIISGGMFYSNMIYLSSGMLRVVSQIVVPFLKCIASMSIITSVTDKVSLTGITEMFRKIVKILLTFCMSVFTAYLTMKSVISVAQDTLSDRAVKFTINNFVPLVGGALSDVYQTVVSCTSVLKSGVGVVAVIAVFAVFLPAILKCIVWGFILMFSTAVCDIFGNVRLCSLLNSVSSVISVICSILISVMAVYIISTAIIIIVGA